MRTLLLGLCILAVSGTASAKADKSAWSNLSVLLPGQKIEVLQINSKKDSGNFLSATDTAITLQEKSGEQTIQKQDVRIVRLMKNKHRVRNTFIGAGIGGAIGAGIGAATGGPCKVPYSCFFYLTRPQQAAVLAVPGIVIGAAVGALWPTREVIYCASGA